MKLEQIKKDLELIFPKIYGNKTLEEVFPGMSLSNEQVYKAFYVFLNNNTYFNVKYFWEKLKKEGKISKSFVDLIKEEIYIELFNKNLQVKN